MADRSWKAVERRVAAIFGTTRTPLSGRNSRHGTASDSLHEKLFIEVKHRAYHAPVTLYMETSELAKKESKTPVVVLAEKRRHTLFAVCPLDPEYLRALASEIDRNHRKEVIQGGQEKGEEEVQGQGGPVGSQAGN